MSEQAPVPQEVLDRLARLEAQVQWLYAKYGALAPPEGAPPGPVPAEPPSPRTPPPHRPTPAPLPPTKPVNPIVWIAGAGSALFLIGAAFFLHWSIQRGWLGPELRFLLGLLGGGVVGTLAARTLLKGSPRLGTALLLAGLGTLIFTFRWGAFEYHFYPPTLGFAATVVCLLVAGGLGARARHGGPLASALGAGLLSPLIFSQGGHHEVALAVYLAVLMGGALAVPYLAGVGGRWFGTRWLAVTGTWMLLAAAVFNVQPFDASLLLLLLVLHLALSGLWIWLPRQPERPGAPTTLWAGAVLAFTGLAAYLWREELRWMPEAFALPVIALAALNLGLVRPARMRLDSRQADFGLLALAAGFLALAVPVALAWRWVGPLWAAFALALAWAAQRKAEEGVWEAHEVRALRRLAFALACAATLRWLVHGFDVWDFGYLPYARRAALVPFFNSRFAEGALAACAWALLIRSGGAFRVLGFLGLQIVGGLTLSLELAHTVVHLGGSVRAGSIVLTLAWALFGALQWLRGLKAQEGALALAAAGYTWLGLASLKLIFADLARADTPTKALAFLGVGAIFLTAALVGNKVRGERGQNDN